MLTRLRSPKEIVYLEGKQKLVAEQIKQIDAAMRIKLSPRQMRRLIKPCANIRQGKQQDKLTNANLTAADDKPLKGITLLSAQGEAIIT